jgi:hypothetical protein
MRDVVEETEFESNDRCAAFAAARIALAAVERAAPSWPGELAGDACRAAHAGVAAIAVAIAHDHASSNRRRYLRAALAAAIDLATALDVARALGDRAGTAADAQRACGRAIAMLGMLFHAATGLVDDGDACQRAPPNASRGISATSSTTCPRGWPETNARS